MARLGCLAVSIRTGIAALGLAVATLALAPCAVLAEGTTTAIPTSASTSTPTAAGSPPVADTPRTVRIGVLAYLGADESAATWQPTIAALDAALPGYRFRLLPLGHADLRKDLEEGKLDFVITNPGHYVELETAFGISRIATLESDRPVSSVVIVPSARSPRGDSPVESLSSLAGKRLAIVAADAFGGFQVIWRELADAGVDPLTDLDLVITGLPMIRVIEAVRDGRADAGIIRGCLLEDLRKAEPGAYDDLRIVAGRRVEGYDCVLSSPVYPDWPFAKTRKTPRGLARKVATALLSMPETPGGPNWTVPLDYQPVHDLFRDLRIGPYAHSGDITFAEIFSAYREWFIIIGMALVGWLLYMVRVEHLVRDRTRALSRANEDLRLEIVERQRVEEADRLHRRELDHVARLSVLGEMVGNIAHELNQPLAAISNYAQGCTLRLRGGNFRADDMEKASLLIAEQAERAATVIQRIRAFVRKRESQTERFAFHAPLEDCRTLIEAVTRQKGVRLDLRLGRDLPEIEGDRVQLQQVILNLAQNAVDAMADMPEERRRLTITSSSDGAGGCLCVCDRGVGIADEALSRFCEPFYTSKPDGLGLGLALSRSIMEAHGGHLAAERGTDGGTVVHMWLPSAPPAGADVATPANAETENDRS